MIHTDDDYLQIVLDAIRVSARYKPKFGQGARGRRTHVRGLPTTVSEGCVLQLVRAGQSPDVRRPQGRWRYDERISADRHWL